MALEKILEFDKNNRYKVKLEVGNVDTSTVDSVEIDKDFCVLEQEDRHTFSFWTLEGYKKEVELEPENWDCKYSLYRQWYVILEDGKLVVKNTNHYEDFLFDDEENFPEGMSSSDLEDKVDKDAKYDILITYENLVEKDELDNLFSDNDKSALERLKVRIKAPYYSVTSVPVEIDWDLCKGYAKEAGVADEYLTEVNFNRALEFALQDTINRYTYSMHLVDCSFYTKDGLIHGETKLTEYNDTIKKDSETISKLTLEKDDLGILRLYVSGEMQDGLEKAKEYKRLIRKIGLEIERFAFKKKQIDDTFRININKKISNILPTVMEGFLTIVETDKNKEWIVKKIELAKELEQAVKIYLKTKIEVINQLEDEIKKKFKIELGDIGTHLDNERSETLKRIGAHVMETLGDLKDAKTKFSDLHGAEVELEDKLKFEEVQHEVSLRAIRSSLERRLSEYGDNEKVLQEIEEVLTVAKQPKVNTTREQMVSAWNKYIGLKIEGEV